MGDNNLLKIETLLVMRRCSFSLTGSFLHLCVLVFLRDSLQVVPGLFPEAVSHAILVKLGPMKD